MKLPRNFEDNIFLPCQNLIRGGKICSFTIYEKSYFLYGIDGIKHAIAWSLVSDGNWVPLILVSRADTTFWAALGVVFWKIILEIYPDWVSSPGDHFAVFNHWAKGLRLVIESDFAIYSLLSWLWRIRLGSKEWIKIICFERCHYLLGMTFVDIKTINICGCLYINLYSHHHLPAGENTLEIALGVFGAFRQAGLLANGSSTRRGYPSKSGCTILSAFRISKTWLLSSKIHRILTKQSIFLQNVLLTSLNPTEHLLTCNVGLWNCIYTTMARFKK